MLTRDPLEQVGITRLTQWHLVARVYEGALLLKPAPLHSITTVAGLACPLPRAPLGASLTTANVHPVMSPHMYMAVSVCSVSGPERTLLREEAEEEEEAAAAAEAEEEEDFRKCTRQKACKAPTG